MDTVELLPCPFCGGINIDRIEQDDREFVLIGCLDCWTQGPSKVTEAEAVAAWNTRLAFRPTPAGDTVEVDEDPFAWVNNLAWHEPAHRAVMASVKLGAWMSAALDDPSVCDAMKADIREWFSAGEPMEALRQALEALSEIPSAADAVTPSGESSVVEPRWQTEGDTSATLSGEGERAKIVAWQPIETAPKDEMILLAGTLDGWTDWRIKVGYFFTEEDRWNIFGASWKPKRWQPLPAPPETERGDFLSLHSRGMDDV